MRGESIANDDINNNKHRHQSRERKILDHERLHAANTLPCCAQFLYCNTMSRTGSGGKVHGRKVGRWGGADSARLGARATALAAATPHARASARMRSRRARFNLAIHVHYYRHIDRSLEATQTIPQGTCTAPAHP